MLLYTRTGDKGETHIIGGKRAKDDLRVEAYGTIDELNSFIGLAVSELTEEKFADIATELQLIQHELFDCGGDLASIDANRPNLVTEEMVTALETRIDGYIKEAPELQRFILPGGTKAASYIHVARTVARRAERVIVSLKKQEAIHEVTLKYVNRLSDYLFAVARAINARAAVTDVEYERSAIVFRGQRK